MKFTAFHFPSQPNQNYVISTRNTNRIKTQSQHTELRDTKTHKSKQLTTKEHNNHDVIESNSFAFFPSHLLYLINA